MTQSGGFWIRRVTRRPVESPEAFRFPLRLIDRRGDLTEIQRGEIRYGITVLRAIEEIEYFRA